jgi:hypothetical protein
MAPDIEERRDSVSRHRATLRMEPVPEPFARVYRRRGMTIPALRTPHSLAALWPVHARNLHRVYAQTHGFFWLPCDLCGTYYGGHEITDLIPDPLKGEGWFRGICPFCSARRNGGTP